MSKIDEPFVPFRRSLLLTLSSLNLIDLRILFRLCIEHLDQKGRRNGGLIVTHDDVREYIGSNRSGTDINRGFDALQRSGIATITQPGNAHPGIGRRATRYRLTFLPTWEGKRSIPPTDEWKEMLSAFERGKQKYSHWIKENVQGGKRPDSRAENAPEEKSPVGRKTPPKVQGGKRPTIYPSKGVRGENASEGGTHTAAPAATVQPEPWHPFRPATNGDGRAAHAIRLATTFDRPSARWRSAESGVSSHAFHCKSPRTRR